MHLLWKPLEVCLMEGGFDIVVNLRDFRNFWTDLITTSKVSSALTTKVIWGGFSINQASYNWLRRFRYSGEICSSEVRFRVLQREAETEGLALR